jgi:RNA polymerase sigma factor (sigma-70 family)
MRLGAAVAGTPPLASARPRVNAEQRDEQFRLIVLPHLADALAFARYLTGSRDDGEDVVQEACLRALAGIGTYAGGSAKAWLLAIVRNACFTWLAKHRPKSLVLTADPTELADVADASEAASTPEAQLIARADSETVAAAIAGLPGVFREVVVLRDINGMSYREIAAMIAIPMGTVMSRLARARRLLAIRLADT